MKNKLIIAAVLIAILTTGLTGCGAGQNTAATTAQNSAASAGSAKASTGTALKKVRVGYFGNTCEAPVFAAYEKGFFKDEGLDVEMVKGDAGTLKDGLATGKIDVTDGLLNQWLKPIEQGLNVKFTGGIHTGCIQVLVPPNSNIKELKDFKGKTIGVPAIGGGPMILVSRLLYNAGIDSKNDVKWKVYPNPELQLALDKGEVDIISLADPLAQINIDAGKAKSVYNSAKDAPSKDEYCCLIVVNGNIVDKDPATAAALTRAIFKGAKWVSANPKEIAQIEVDKKYVPGDPAVNAKILADYNFNASVEGGANAVLVGAKEMKNIGVLDKDTDAEQLAKSSFVRLKGIE